MKEKVIFIGLPGNSFSSRVVFSFLDLYNRLLADGYTIAFGPGVGSNIVSVRNGIMQSFRMAEIQPVYILWLDSDNTLTFDQFKQLESVLENNSRAGIVGAWCWIQADEGYPTFVNAGWDHKYDHIRTAARYECVSAEKAMSHTTEPLRVDYVGFGCVLTKGQVYLDLPVKPFTHNLNGIETSDDVGFCEQARAKGWEVYILPSVEIPHLKERALQYVSKRDATEGVKDRNNPQPDVLAYAAKEE